MAKAVFKECVAKIASTREDYCTRKPDLETVHIVAINLKSEPKKEIVEDGEDSGGGNSIVGEHVRHHGHFVMNRSAGPEEKAKLLGDGSHMPPIDKRIED